ncbi:unnamed protein product [Bathycoccus prasinos]
MELDGGSDSDNSDNIYGKTNFVEENCSFNFVSDIRFWGSSSRAEGLKQFFDVLTSELYPSPHFEGVEKRIEINFRVAADDNKSTGGIIPVAGGLRCLSRAALDVCMTAAECEIVSVRSNEKFDAYVLSESSLFVFADKIVLKTCGTTKLLSAVDPIWNARLRSNV